MIPFPFQAGGLGLSQPSGSAGDPFFANVSLLLPMTSDFVDVTGKTVTVEGAVISSGSALFDGMDDRLSLAIDSGFGFGSGDYTVEFDVLMDASSGIDETIFDSRTASNTGCAGYSNSSTYPGLAFATNTSTVAGQSSALSTSVFEHGVICRQGTTVRIYVEGVQVASVTDSRTYASASTFFIGGNYVSNSSQPLTGRLRHFRVTKGVCRYPDGTTFTPPSRPYPTS